MDLPDSAVFLQLALGDRIVRQMARFPQILTRAFQPNRRAQNTAELFAKGGAPRERSVSLPEAESEPEPEVDAAPEAFSPASRILALREMSTFSPSVGQLKRMVGVLGPREELTQADLKPFRVAGRSDYSVKNQLLFLCFVGDQKLYGLGKEPCRFHVPSGRGPHGIRNGFHGLRRDTSHSRVDSHDPLHQAVLAEFVYHGADAMRKGLRGNGFVIPSAVVGSEESLSDPLRQAIMAESALCIYDKVAAECYGGGGVKRHSAAAVAAPVDEDDLPLVKRARAGAEKFPPPALWTSRARRRRAPSWAPKTGPGFWVPCP